MNTKPVDHKFVVGSFPRAIGALGVLLLVPGLLILKFAPPVPVWLTVAGFALTGVGLALAAAAVRIGGKPPR